MYQLYIRESYYRIGLFRLETFTSEYAMEKRKSELAVYKTTKIYTSFEQMMKIPPKEE